eukprot:TRINITY_DN32828_c0_g1_i4.p1 TRINITY_DN32828_c0_g1~~TRINITY_DN32828_c0_g1_i4.p1  ORF type:complete len:727 (-),score=57.20 TRINITY_DN32828_c0_g1_i4:73-2253(-)
MLHVWLNGLTSLVLSISSVPARGAQLLCRQGAPGVSNPPLAKKKSVVWQGRGDSCTRVGAADVASCRWETNVSTVGNLSSAEQWELEATLQAYGGTVCSVAWDPTGLKIISGQLDGTVEVWHADVQENLTQWTWETKLVGHEDAVHTLAFSPESDLVISGSADGTAKIWSDVNRNLISEDVLTEPRLNLGARNEEAVLDGLNNTSNDSNYTSESADVPGPVYRISKDEWTELVGPRWGLVAALQDHADSVWFVEWANNESRVFVGNKDRTGCLWKDAYRIPRQGSDMVFATCTDRDKDRAEGNTVLRHSYDRTGRVWRAIGPSYPPMWRVEARLQDRHRQTHIVLDAALSSSGSKLVTGSADGIVRVWHVGERKYDIGHDQTQWELLGALKEHRTSVWAVAWSPDEMQLISASGDGVTHSWRQHSDEAYQWEVAGSLNQIKCLFTGDDEITSAYYAGQDMTHEVEGDLLDWQKDKALTVTPVPGEYLVITTRNYQPRACSSGGFAMTCTNGVSTALVDVYLGWEALGSAANFSEEHMRGEGAGWTSPKPSHSRFFLRADRLMHKICATHEPYSAYRIRLDTLAARGVGAFDNRATSAGEPLGPRSAGTREAFGQHGSMPGSLQRRFVQSPDAVGNHAFRRAGEVIQLPAVWAASWSPDGSWVATASKDGAVRVWRQLYFTPIVQWRLEATLRGHTGVVWSLEWSPDSRKLLSGGEDGHRIGTVMVR